MPDGTPLRQDDAAYRPETIHADLGAEFFDTVQAAAFPETILRYRNGEAARSVGLAALSDAEWIAHFGRFKPLTGSFPQPLALRYHGHQFRVYNPDIGDGRGFLFTQLRDGRNRLLDLGTKGSGQTPWSRSGDGRLTLKGGVREVLATTMLEALGVNTSRSFSLIETGESLWRGDEPSPTRSSVLVRLSHSHIRIGTFQRLLYLGQDDDIARLVHHCIAHYWPQADGAEDRAAAFFALVVDAVAKMGAQWYAAGFVHGVLNTDNITITGESFDYGPWRFLPTLDPHFTAAYFDQSGLYAFGRQADALYWNLARLGECLLSQSSVDALTAILDTFPARFEAHLGKRTMQRLGVKPVDPDADYRLAQIIFKALSVSRVPFEQFFFDFIGGAREDRLAASPQADIYAGDVFRGVIAALRARQPLEAVEDVINSPPLAAAAPETMLIDEVEAIWSAIADKDDWQPLYDKLSRVEAYGASLKAMATA